MTRPLTTVEVCTVDELPDPGAHGFSPPGARFPDEYFVVRHGNELACFSNVCTHMGNPLNWAPNRFLSRDGSLILCSVHGAIYDPITGECRGGPCRGQGLKRWPVAVSGGVIMAEVPPAPESKPDV
ncbi:MAG: Rieske (2Fe-2S) protein [Gammaproteobacteria bacterium]